MHLLKLRRAACCWLCLPLLVLTLACGHQSPTNPTAVTSTSTTATGSNGTGSGASGSCAQVYGLGENHFNQLGGQTTLKVAVTSPTCTWSLPQVPDWIHLEPASGTGNATIAVTVLPSEETRQFTITTPPTSVTIFQAPQQICTVSLQASRTTFDETGGQVTLQVTTSVTSCDWRIFSVDSWMHLSQASGSGNVTLTAQIDPSERSLNGSIVVVHETPYSSASVPISVVSRVVLPMSFGYASCGSIQAGGPSKIDLCHFIVTPGQNPPSDKVRVSADLRPVGGGATVWLLKEIMTGQLEFSLDLSVPVAIPAGPKSVTFTASDGQGRTATTTMTIVVLPPG